MGAGARSQGGEDTPALGRYCMSRPSSAHMPSAPTNTTLSEGAVCSPPKGLGLGTSRPSFAQRSGGTARLPDARLPRRRPRRRRCSKEEHGLRAMAHPGSRPLYSLRYSLLRCYSEGEIATIGSPARSIVASTVVGDLLPASPA